jgi:hypothetical protein
MTFKIRAKVSHASAIVKSGVLSRDMLAFIRREPLAVLEFNYAADAT